MASVYTVCTLIFTGFNLQKFHPRKLGINRYAWYNDQHLQILKCEVCEHGKSMKYIYIPRTKLKHIRYTIRIMHD